MAFNQNAGDLLSRGKDPLHQIMLHTSTTSGRNGKHQGYAAIPAYEDGIDNVPEDQLALIHKGEAVVPAEQNPNNKPVLIQPSLTDEQKVKQDAQEHVQNPGAQVISSDVPNQIAAPKKDELISTQAIPTSKPAPQSAQTTESTKSPDELAAIKNAIDVDRKQGAGQGAKGLVKMGLANIHENNLIAEPSTSDVTGQITPTTAPAPAPRDLYQTQAGGALIPTGGENETSGQRKDLAGMERKATLAQYDQRIQNARNTGDETSADKLMLAKMEYQRNQPWSDRSTGSKIGKIASTIGNIAGDIVAPSTMALIPGTALNRAMKEKAALHEKVTK